MLVAAKPAGNCQPAAAATVRAAATQHCLCLASVLASLQASGFTGASASSLEADGVVASVRALNNEPYSPSRAWVSAQENLEFHWLDDHDGHSEEEDAEEDDGEEEDAEDEPGPVERAVQQGASTQERSGGREEEEDGTEQHMSAQELLVPLIDELQGEPALRQLPAGRHSPSHRSQCVPVSAWAAARRSCKACAACAVGAAVPLRLCSVPLYAGHFTRLPFSCLCSADRFAFLRSANLDCFFEAHCLAVLMATARHADAEAWRGGCWRWQQQASGSLGQGMWPVCAAWRHACTVPSLPACSAGGVLIYD